MPIPEPARSKLERRLHARREERWPELRDLAVRYRADLAYITGADDDGPLPLCRLRYTGSPDEWGFACYLASKGRLPGLDPAQRQLHRDTRTSPRLRLRPPPQRSFRMGR